MTTRTNDDGTINVRVVLRVQVDPRAWAAGMMGESPDEILQKDVRRDVKKRIRNKIAEWPMSCSDYDEEMNVPVGDVTAEGVY